MAIKVIPLLKDNYGYLIDTPHGAICIDPSDAKPILNAHENLIAILNTHHHIDHIEGNQDLIDRFHCPLFAPNDERIPGVSTIVAPGETITIEDKTFKILSTPGHTRTHIAYYEKALQALFCGDTLFAAGCGRILEGTPEQMLASLQTICQLPPSTLIYCGHEYTVRNLEFALAIEPANAKVQKRFAHARALREQNMPTVPTTLKEELETNPFLRCDKAALKKAMGIPEATTLETFTTLRSLKDNF